MIVSHRPHLKSVLCPMRAKICPSLKQVTDVLSVAADNLFCILLCHFVVIDANFQSVIHGVPAVFELFPHLSRTLLPLFQFPPLAQSEQDVESRRYEIYEQQKPEKFLVSHLSHLHLTLYSPPFVVPPVF